MMFASGREAVLFYVKEREMGFVPSGLEYFMEDEGFHLQYDSNTIPGAPHWTETIETLIDLEKVFKASLNELEIHALMAWANSDCDDPNLNSKPGLTEYKDLTKTGKWLRIHRMLAKVENGLRKFKYLDPTAMDKTRYKKPKCVI